LRLHIETLEFANVGGHGADADAARGQFVPFGIEQTTLGRHVFAGEAGHFGFEILETQIESKTRGIVAEELANLFDLGLVARTQYL
jgi:hypothetical protein